MAAIDIVSSDQAPKAIGPYAQATIVGNLVYTAGQIGLDPTSMDVVPGGVAEQTEQVFKNLIAVLTAAGTGLDRVAKTTVFLADMAEFAAMNEVYAKAFGNHRPARSTVAVAGLPRNVRVEIECIAVR
ncbi:MAG: RidA family protein [Gemmatimonadales bacterium]|nr:RidA family protein [Gemmatimonadota bacterium]MCC7131543.1 RidA family protein [Gemmatimonadales bacterium]MDX2058764.1 RidA family protein [Gemmatimonadales bacterium]